MSIEARALLVVKCGVGFAFFYELRLLTRKGALAALVERKKVVARE